MYGFNVTAQTFSYDNRPQTPLQDMPFNQWWFVSAYPTCPSSESVDQYARRKHGFLDYPPNPGDFVELPAGGSINAELSCDKGATMWYNSSQGCVPRFPCCSLASKQTFRSGDAGYGSNWPCPGAPSSEFHTTSQQDVKGCALAIADKTDGKDVQPDDFTIFSVNQSCVWYLNTEFQVPAQLPACSGENCVCAWFWIHSVSGWMHSPEWWLTGLYIRMTAVQSRVSASLI